MYRCGAARPGKRWWLLLAFTLALGTCRIAAASAGADSLDGAAAKQATAERPARELAVYFEHRSSELSPEALAVVARNAERLKSDAAASVTLVGYADGVGSSSYGIALAQRRASAVADALVGMGADPHQIHSTAYGEEAGDAEPCAEEPCETGYRMVEFRYLKPQTADLQWRGPRGAR